MELQHLRYFRDIARLESISRAAEVNHIAQPAMSRVVSVLEKEFGVALFDRVGRNIRLNACGGILLKAAEQSLSILDSVQEEIDFYNGQITGSVKVCVHAPVYLFGELCETFRRIYPLVKMDVQNPPVGEVMMLSPQYDLFLYMGPVKYDGSYTARCLLSQELVALVRPENPLSGQGCISFQDLANQELVVPRFGAVRDIIYAYCYQSGFIPKVAGEVSLTSGQKMLLDTQPERRAAVLLREVDGDWGGDYRVLTFADPPRGVDISLAWSCATPLRPSVEAFRDFALHYYMENDPMYPNGMDVPYHTP